MFWATVNEFFLKGAIEPLPMAVGISSLGRTTACHYHLGAGFRGTPTLILELHCQNRCNKTLPALSGRLEVAIKAKTKATIEKVVLQRVKTIRRSLVALFHTPS